MTVGVVVGPTAAGKSAIAHAIALAVPGTELVSVDSMQVYRGMDIGTAKATAQERAEVRYHMVDIVEPEVAYSVAEFQEQGRRAIADAAGPAIIVGGSGLHMRSLIDPLRFPPSDPDVRRQLEALGRDQARWRLLQVDPEAADLVDLDNPRRVIRALEIYELEGMTPSERAKSPDARAVADYEPELPVSMVGLDPGDDLRERIARRVVAMLDAGWLDEVAALRGRLGTTARGAVGYRELEAVLDGETSLDEAGAAIADLTWGLAKRQRTFFAKDPRIRWVPWHDDMVDAVRQALEDGGWNS